MARTIFYGGIFLPTANYSPGRAWPPEVLQVLQHSSGRVGVSVVDPIVIVGLVMILTQLVKDAAGRAGVDPKLIKQAIVPITVLLLSGGLNVLNVYLFGGPAPGQLEPGALRKALLDGLQFGAVASGIYGLGKAALGRS